MIINNRYLVKIPKDITVIYSKTNNVLVLSGSTKKKYIKIIADIKIDSKDNSLYLLDYKKLDLSSEKKKNLKAFKGTALANIKKAIIEIKSNIFVKLKLIGVGFRAFEVENYENRIIMFKLGYSHSIYMCIPENIKTYCLKLTKLFIFGSSYNNIFQYAAEVRHKKYPEPYKGKGILYENEKIILKEGKKK